MLQVLERQEGKVEKVARATGGIENTHVPQPVQECLMQGLCSVVGSVLCSRCCSRSVLYSCHCGRLEALHLLGDLRLESLPFPVEWPDEHGFDQHHDFVAVGVVYPKLAPFVWVETSVKQCTEDRGVNIVPIQLGCFEDQL